MIFLTPKCRQTGDNLLFSAHDLRQEHLVLFWCHTKCLADYIIVTNVENVCAFHQYVRQHKDDQGDTFLLGDCFHLSKQFLFSTQHAFTIHAGNLCHCQVMTGNMEFLIIRVKQFLCGFSFHRSGEYLLWTSYRRVFRHRWQQGWRAFFSAPAVAFMRGRQLLQHLKSGACQIPGPVPGYRHWISRSGVQNQSDSIPFGFHQTRGQDRRVHTPGLPRHFSKMHRQLLPR